MENLLLEIVDHSLHLILGNRLEDPEVPEELYLLIQLSDHGSSKNVLVILLVKHSELTVLIARYGGCSWLRG